MPNLSSRRLTTVAFVTAIAFGITAAPALADSTGLRVEEFLRADEQDETPLEDGELLDIAADQDGALLVTYEREQDLGDGESSQVLRFEGRTEPAPLTDLTFEDSETSEVVVTEDGDTYFSSSDGAIYRADEDDAPEELVSAGDFTTTVPMITAGPDGLYISDGGEISWIDPDAPDDPEAVVDVRSHVSGMHMAGDTLYAATWDDVFAIEEPGGGEAEAESVLPPSVTLPEGAALDVTVDEDGRVYVIGEYGVLDLSEERMFTEVTGSLIEATAEGIVAGTERSDLTLLRELSSGGDVTPSMNWAEHPDLVTTEYISADSPGSLSPGSLHVVAQAPADSIAFDQEGLTIPVTVPELPEGITMGGTPSAPGSYAETVQHTEDGALWFLTAGTLTVAPNSEQATATGSAIMTFGQDLEFAVGEPPEPAHFQYVVRGEDALYVATEDDVFQLDSSGSWHSMLDQEHIDEIQAISAQGDTLYVLERPDPPDSGSHVVEVTTSSQGKVFDSNDVEEIDRVDDFVVAADGTFYMTDSEGGQVFRVQGDEVDIIAGASPDQEVHGSHTATETSLARPERPMLDGAGNLIFSDNSGIQLLVDAANAPVHPDNDPWRIPRIMAPLVALTLLAAGGVLWWLHRRTQAAEPTATPAAEKPKTSESPDADEHH